MLSSYTIRRFKIAIILWCLSAIILQFVISIMQLEYDSQNSGSVIWWLAQLFAIPATGLIEILRYYDLIGGGYAVTIITIVVIGLFAYILLSFVERTKAQ